MGAHGLLSLAAGPNGPAINVAADGFVVQVNGTDIGSATLALPKCAQTGPDTAWCNYTAPLPTAAWHASATATATTLSLPVHYQVHASGFVSKTVFVAENDGATLRIGSATPFALTTLAPASGLAQAMVSTGPLGGQELGLLRFSDGTGVFILAQNPLLRLDLDNNTRDHSGRADQPQVLRVSVSYSADLLHDPSRNFTNTRTFALDSACLGIYNLTGRAVPPPLKKGLSSLSTWAPAGASSRTPPAAGPALATRDAGLTLDEAERDAVTACAAAYYIAPPVSRTVKMNVAWTENDYQMDMANFTQAAEYHRVMQTLNAIGVGAITYAPSNSDLSTRANCSDSWCWEEALWFSLGEHIRADRWMPGRDPVPATVAAPLQWAKALNVDLHPYIYPILPFVQNPSWLTPDGRQAYLGDPDLLFFVLSTLGEEKRGGGVI
jgi:hypothetical protein